MGLVDTIDTVFPLENDGRSCVYPLVLVQQLGDFAVPPQEAMFLQVYRRHPRAGWVFFLWNRLFGNGIGCCGNGIGCCGNGIGCCGSGIGCCGNGIGTRETEKTRDVRAKGRRIRRRVPHHGQRATTTEGSKKLTLG